MKVGIFLQLKLNILNSRKNSQCIQYKNRIWWGRRSNPLLFHIAESCSLACLRRYLLFFFLSFTLIFLFFFTALLYFFAFFRFENFFFRLDLLLAFVWISVEYFVSLENQIYGTFSRSMELRLFDCLCEPEKDYFLSDSASIRSNNVNISTLLGPPPFIWKH